MFDRNGRLHDELGRFAGAARRRVEAREHDTRPGNRTSPLRRAPAAFAPPTPAATRRDQKDRVTDAGYEVRTAFDKRQRGEQLTNREFRLATWASPQKQAEQRAKTGDDFMSRREALRRARSMATAPRTPRVGVTRTFTGKAKVVRGNGPEMGVPLTSEARAMLASRVDLVDFRDAVSTRRKPGAARKRGPEPAAPSQTAAGSYQGRHSAAPDRITAAHFADWTDTAVKDLARSLGIVVLPRADRDQLIAEILKHQ